MFPLPICFSFFFFNDTATTEIYTLSLHDALPISIEVTTPVGSTTAKFTVTDVQIGGGGSPPVKDVITDRKSTRLNSSHGYISYAVFCLKKKKKTTSKRS